MSYLYHKANDTVKRYDLIKRGDRILVSVSGGPDSVALFRFLNELSCDLDLNIQIFHMNHLIRKESDNDELFVKELGMEFDIKTHIRRADVREFASLHKLSLQAGAREVRYGSMEEVARVNDLNKIATGHIKDDVTETFIMRVASGSGLRGLTGIPPKRSDKFIRPLIGHTKWEINSWLDQLGQKYVVDKSNKSNEYYRNRIRNQMMPHLDEEGLDDIVFQTCEIIRDDESRRERLAKSVFAKVASVDSGEISLPINNLKNETLDTQTRILRNCWDKLNPSFIDKPTIKQLEDVARKLSESDFSSIDLQGGISASKEGDRLVIYSGSVGSSIKENELVIGRDNSISLVLNISVELSDPSELNLKGDNDTAYVDEGKIKWPLSVRSFKPGDSFIPFGMAGSKKVKDFFIDEKIPKRRRNNIPIIEDREKIVWIAGHRSDERVRVDKSTGKVAVLKIESRE